MSPEANKEVIRRFYDGFNRRNINAIMSLVADDIVNHTARPGYPSGAEGVRQGSMAIRTAFPQLQTTVDLLIAEGDLVTAVHTHDGVHGGLYGNIPATGKQFHINGIEVFRVVNGRITEFWQRDDELGTLVQIGVVPAQGR